jgi:hypothetical protein
VAYQDCLENRLTVNSAVSDDEAIDKCAEQVTNTIQEALAASAPKRRPLADSRPSLPRPKTQANPFFFQHQIQWVETARHLGVTPDARLTGSAHSNQAGTKVA